MKQPKVSICMIAYNNEMHIAQAIESVLNQQTNFNYEIVIGEDCSSDRTREICNEYAINYPDKIRLFLRERQEAKNTKYQLPMMHNFIETLNACQMEYIALLEGDDYWTDPLKLQKQVDFLDGHPESSTCFHNVEVLIENSCGKPYPYYLENQKEKMVIEDILCMKAGLPTCSVVFRRGLFSEFPKWYFELPMGDWPLHILNTQHGWIGYINEVMGVFRRHQDSSWSQKDWIERYEKIIQMYETVNCQLDFKYDKLIKSMISLYFYRIAQLHLKRGDLAKAINYTIRCLRKKLFNKQIGNIELLTFLINLLVSPFYRSVNKLQRIFHAF